ncbi:MAG: GtrA family protein [Ferrimicrobium sp.]
MRVVFFAVRDMLVRRFGITAVKYGAVSAISVAITEALLFILFAIFRISATGSNVIATAVAAVPSYYLNRSWAWGKSGHSHLVKEVIPFWALAFLGLWLSIFTVGVANGFAVSHGYPHIVDALLVNTASIAAFGIVWIGKFFIFNKFLFVTVGDAESVA